MTTTTATFRNYNTGNPEFGDFWLDTDNDINDTAVFMEIWQDDDGALGQRAEFNRDQARELGLRLIAWTGEEWAFMLTAQQKFDGVVSSLTLDVVDGVPTMWVGNGPDFMPSAEMTHDMGVRLIAWAGVGAVETADV